LFSSIDSEINAANKLYDQWQTFSPVLNHINKFSYEIDVSKYTPINQWSGITVFDTKDNKELIKINRLSMENPISFSSLVKSGSIESTSIYYVNYGRQEDFSYLFQNRIRFENTDKSILFLRRQSTIISQIEQIHQAIHYGFGGLVLFDDNENQQITTTNNRHSFFLEWARYRGAKGIANRSNQSKFFFEFSKINKIFSMVFQMIKIIRFLF
jgi:hypothetical protein